MKKTYKIAILIIVIVALLLTVILLFGSYVSSMLLGFGTKKPVSIELIRYNWSKGIEENVLITDNEEILELYDAIRYANIKKVQFDSEGMETDGDLAIVLHFTNEDVYMSTRGEGMKDSVYFRRYLNQNTTDDFVEIWLDNEELIEILKEYE